MSLAELFFAKNHARQNRKTRALHHRRYKPLPRHNRLLFEPLETRLLLSTVAHWAGDSSNWFDPTQWNKGVAEDSNAGSGAGVIVDAEQSIAPTGNPLQLPGLRLINPDASCFQGQTFYVDTDGAEDINYDGPVTIKDIDITPFKAPESLAGQEQEIIESVVTRLENSLGSLGLDFTTTKPEGETPFSTIYIGETISAFSEYGALYGVAEAVDVGNRKPSDNAFVFTDAIASGTSDRKGFIDRLRGTMAHEAAHLLGYAHMYRLNGGVLSTVSVVRTLGPKSSNSEG